MHSKRTPWRDWLRLSALGALLLAMPPAHGGDINEAAFAALTSHDAACRDLLARRTIRVHSRGVIHMDFAVALDLLRNDSFIDRIQEAYAASLPEGQTPEFVITPVAGERTWSFVNRHGQHSRIDEVARVVTEQGQLRVAIHASGARFFGRFESLTLIEAWAGDDGSACYVVLVHAWPQGALPRFFIRRLGLVERFFRDKTREIESLGVQIGRRLVTGREENR